MLAAARFGEPALQLGEANDKISVPHAVILSFLFSLSGAKLVPSSIERSSSNEERAHA